MSTLKYLLIGIVLLYILMGAVIYFFQEKFIFLPAVLPSDFQFRLEVPYEEHMLETHENGRINLLHLKTDSSKGLIVYFHGNAGSLDRWSKIVEPFAGLGYEVLICDYRGYGKSQGEITQENLLHDADEVYSFALTLEEEDRIIVFGRSLGSGFASYLAGKYSPGKLILETPFYSLEAEANRRFMIYPVSWLLRYQLKNHEFLKTNKAPVYVFHGTEDKVVSYESGTRLFNKVPSNEGKFITIVGGYHNNLSEYPLYWQEIKTLLHE